MAKEAKTMETRAGETPRHPPLVLEDNEALLLCLARSQQCRRAQERLTKFNECLLNFGSNPEENINRLVALCGELMEAVCALYNRLDGGLLCSIGHWNTPADYNPVCRPEGHICYDVILRASDSPLVVRRLAQTSYASTDPNVSLYQLQTYIGQAVKFGGESIGSLCVVFQHDFIPHDEDLKLMGAIAAAIAVEENRRLAVKELQESKERYQLLVETMNEGLALADENYAFAYVNNRLCQMLGYRREEMLGRTLLEFIPDDFKATMMAQMASRRAGRAERYEIPWMGKNGQLIQTLISPRGFYDKEGRFLGSLGVLTDISERKRMEEALQKAHDDLESRVEKRTAQLVRANRNLLQEIQERRRAEQALKDSEARYRLLAENVSDVIWTTDLNLKITYVSPSIKLLLGFTPREVLELGVPGTIRDSSLKLVQQTLAEERALECLESRDLTRSRTLELELIRKDGSPVWAEVRTTFIRDVDGKAVGLLGISRDISERKQAEQELARYREGLEKLVEERTAELSKANKQLREEIKERRRVEAALKRSAEKIKLFAYSVSHDLKNPAIAIHGLARLFHQRYQEQVDEKGKHICHQILREAEQISSLVEMINVYVATKEVPLKIAKIRLKEILQVVREEFSASFQVRGIKWSEPEQVPEFRADKLSILRALQNLVDNALKYGGDDLTEIAIGCEAADGNHIISVTDDGKGLTLEDRESIFGLFQRPETSTGVQGSGLGLAIVKEIAERHGGKVWVESSPERGTTFYFSISTRGGLEKRGAASVIS